MLETRITDDPADVLQVLTALLEHAHELPRGHTLARSLDRLTSDDSYRFVIARDVDADVLTAAGVITFFHQPMADDHVVGVEALWCRDGGGEAPCAVLAMLAEFSRKLDFGGVCISPHSTNTREALRRLVERGALDGDPVTLNALPLQKQGNPSPVPTAFSDDEITDAAFVSVPSVIVHTRKALVDVAGREFTGTGALYRGEGRLVCPPSWDCTDLGELATVHFERGFLARQRELPAGSDAEFGGTIAEQLLHQGYVGQGAVSLSTSFEAAAMYATHAGQREQALVFAVDAELLRGRTKIFDARATLSAACPWVPAETWVPLRRIVLALWSDLRAAGQFLERCHEAAFERARTGAVSLVPRTDPAAYLPAQARRLVGSHGLTTDDLYAVQSAFEEFAEYALQRVGSVDSIRVSGAESSVETRRAGPMAYFEVFARVLDPLLGARPNAEPGWDTTPMGYIAKTVRDDECFAAGPVPGECITAGYIVDRYGRALHTLERL